MEFMQTLPRISIVTPSFNSAVTIRETIRSVWDQGYPDLEHIVMDGGSTDGTLGIVKEYPQIICFSEKDEGHYHAMNKGIERATGSVVAILNTDDTYAPGALLQIGRAFAERPDWDGLFTDVAYIDGAGNRIMERHEAVFDYNVLRFARPCYVVHPTLFLRKSTYQRLGAYKHREFLNCCDVELILRLGKSRCRIGHLSGCLVNYRLHQHGQSADLRVARNMETESVRIRAAHGCPAGVAGKVFGVCYRAKRQLQKLLYRGRCDLIPGGWILKKQMRAKTTFSSNIGVDRL